MSKDKGLIFVQGISKCTSAPRLMRPWSIRKWRQQKRTHQFMELPHTTFDQSAPYLPPFYYRRYTAFHSYVTMPVLYQNCKSKWRKTERSFIISTDRIRYMNYLALLINSFTALIANIFAAPFFSLFSVTKKKTIHLVIRIRIVCSKKIYT